MKVFDSPRLLAIALFSFYLRFSLGSHCFYLLWCFCPRHPQSSLAKPPFPIFGFFFFFLALILRMFLFLAAFFLFLFLCFAACPGLIRMFHILYGLSMRKTWDEWLWQGCLLGAAHVVPKAEGSGILILYSCLDDLLRERGIRVCSSFLGEAKANVFPPRSFQSPFARSEKHSATGAFATPISR